MKQDDVFFAGEGDHWWQRNASFLEAKIPTDWPLHLITQYALAPARVLEIGCSNGWRLAAINRRLGVPVTGVEPSMQAIADGQSRYPAIRFVRATASAIPLEEQFSLVIVNFVLHWVSRDTLMVTLGEIDRMVAPGGYLIVGDFLPDAPTSVRYHHLPEQEVYTYKQDYAAPFLATGCYAPLSLVVFDHATGKPRSNLASMDRAACVLLSKIGAGGYAAITPHEIR